MNVLYIIIKLQVRVKFQLNKRMLSSVLRYQKAQAEKIKSGTMQVKSGVTKMEGVATKMEGVATQMEGVAQTVKVIKLNPRFSVAFALDGMFKMPKVIKIVNGINLFIVDVSKSMTLSYPMIAYGISSIVAGNLNSKFIFYGRTASRVITASELSDDGFIKDISEIRITDTLKISSVFRSTIVDIANKFGVDRDATLFCPPIEQFNAFIRSEAFDGETVGSVTFMTDGDAHDHYLESMKALAGAHTVYGVLFGSDAKPIKGLKCESDRSMTSMLTRFDTTSADQYFANYLDGTFTTTSSKATGGGFKHKKLTTTVSDPKEIRFFSLSSNNTCGAIFNPSSEKGNCFRINGNEFSGVVVDEEVDLTLTLELLLHSIASLKTPSLKDIIGFRTIFGTIKSIVKSASIPMNATTSAFIDTAEIKIVEIEDRFKHLKEGDLTSSSFLTSNADLNQFVARMLRTAASFSVDLLSHNSGKARKIIERGAKKLGDVPKAQAEAKALEDKIGFSEITCLSTGITDDAGHKYAEGENYMVAAIFYLREYLGDSEQQAIIESLLLANPFLANLLPRFAGIYSSESIISMTDSRTDQINGRHACYVPLTTDDNYRRLQSPIANSTVVLGAPLVGSGYLGLGQVWGSNLGNALMMPYLNIQFALFCLLQSNVYLNASYANVISQKQHAVSLLQQYGVTASFTSRVSPTPSGLMHTSKTMLALLAGGKLDASTQIVLAHAIILASMSDSIHLFKSEATNILHESIEVEFENFDVEAKANELIDLIKSDKIKNGGDMHFVLSGLTQLIPEEVNVKGCLLQNLHHATTHDSTRDDPSIITKSASLNDTLLAIGRALAISEYNIESFPEGMGVPDEEIQRLILETKPFNLSKEDAFKIATVAVAGATATEISQTKFPDDAIQALSLLPVSYDVALQIEDSKNQVIRNIIDKYSTTMHSNLESIKVIFHLHFCKVLHNAPDIDVKALAEEWKGKLDSREFTSKRLSEAIAKIQYTPPDVFIALFDTILAEAFCWGVNDEISV